MWRGRRRRPLRDRYRPVWLQKKAARAAFFLCVAIENGGFCATAPKKLSGIQKKDGLVLQCKQRRGDDVPQRLVRHAAAHIEFLPVDGTKNVVDGILVDQQPGVFGLGKQRRHLLLAGGDGQRRQIHPGDAGATISTVVVTVVVLIFGEISPKSIAKDCAEEWAMTAAPFLRCLIWLLMPLNVAEK